MVNKIKLFLATANSGKIKELSKLLANYDIYSIGDFPYIEEPEETGSDFEANSLLKAKYYFEKTGVTSIADDGGLCVAALDGRPGVYSARYLKSSGIEGLQQELEGKDTAAYFESVITIYDATTEKQFSGKCYGNLTFPAKGDSGFGYDPVFIPTGYDKTFAELGSDIKNKISHRSQAIGQLISLLLENGI
jgi:XTP/dITP diphosphohydrolase